MKHALLRGASAVAVTIVAGLWSTQALAQAAATPPQSAAAAAAPQGASADVIVTADKRSQRIERVPVAISAFTARQREVLGIKTVQQLSDFTPGLSYYAIADRAYVRGIGRNTVNLATESGVATYYNGVYYGANASIAQARDSLFIGQIEVDRGPQNTLHGSNADGGVINYISVRPTKSFYAEARAGAQDYDEYYVEGAVSGPVTDNLRLRAAGMYADQTGGFFKNLIGPPEGGYLPQGNGGNSEYAELQFDTNIGNVDGWGMISTADYDTNFHTVATVGPVNDYEYANPAGDLTPGAFFGLCGLPGHGADAGCSGNPDTIVPGSVVTTAVNAAQFPGNNPSTANLHRFIETSNQSNRQTRDIALATNWTAHFNGVDLQYIAGYQQFYYDLQFGPGVDAGVLQYKLAGAPNPVVAGIGCGAVIGLTGPALANCITAAQQPLTINPSQAHTLFIENEQYFSHELNLISTDKGPLQWVAGAYWYHEHFDQPVSVGCYPNQTQLAFPVSLASIGGAAFIPTPVNHTNCTVNLDGFATYDSIAGYGQLTYQFSPEWKIEGAARYTDDRKTGGEGFRVISFDILHPGLLGSATPAFDVTPAITGAPGQCTAPFAPGATGCSVNAQGYITRRLRGSWNGFTGDATLTWTPDSETLAYLRYARGYKTGGFNSGTISAHPLTSPEYVDAYEFGAKKSWGGLFQLNGALFYYSYQNDQQPLGVQSSPGVTSSQIFNIPSVHTYGLELEAVWHPIEPLVFTGTYSYLNATVNSMNGKCVVNANDLRAILPGDRTGGCAVSPPGVAQSVNIVGNELPESPRNKFALNGTYTWAFEPGKLSFSASVIWKDKTYGDIFNTPFDLGPAYTQVNLRATWVDAENRYTITGFVDNLFNQTGFDNVTATQIAPGTANPAVPYDLVRGTGITYPLTFGIEAQVRFK